MKTKFEMVVIGVSAGGSESLRIILSALPGDFLLSIVIVQHLHPNSDNFLACYLNEKSELTVKEADEKESIKAGMVYIAPPNYHLLIEEDKTFSLSISERVNYARPSIDVLFETAADAYGSNLIGIILTGANHDGSQGLKRIKERGGLTIVQDPKTAEVDSMPKAAMAATEVDHVLPLEQIALFLQKIVNSP
ncbi:MAG: chemotaxis protein CheB [bacterium]